MSPALQPQPEIITLEQYEALPENKRVEIFNTHLILVSRSIFMRIY